MNTRLCAYEDLTLRQRELLREIEVRPEQVPFCGTVESALHALPTKPHAGIKGLALLRDERPVAFLLLKREPLLAHWAEAGSATLHALQVDSRVQAQGLGKACLRELPRAIDQFWPEIRQLMLSSARSTPARWPFTWARAGSSAARPIVAKGAWCFHCRPHHCHNCKQARPPF